MPYLQSITAHLHSAELKKAPSPTYMSRQSDLTPRMREILVDWLVEVHVKFRLEAETLYLCVSLIDRFLERRAVMRSKLQLVGCTALLLAAKYEEVWAPEVMDFVHIADQTYSREQILQMESIMLNALHFSLTSPSPYRFLQRYHMLAAQLCVKGAGGGGGGGEGEDALVKRFRLLCEYLLELTLQEYRMLTFLPSVVAASCLFIGLESMGVEWGEELEGYVGYGAGRVGRRGGGGGGGTGAGPGGASGAGVVECIVEVMAVVNGGGKYRAVRKKYADSAKYDAVSKITIRNPLE